MARAIWTGAISFGLVTVPVRLYTAISSHKPTFHQFKRGTSQRIRNRRVTEDTGEEVGYDDVVKGAHIGDGRHVIVTPEELEAIEPGRSRALEIEDFVDLSDIDPVVWDTTYYLGPDGDAAERPYELLRRAMVNTGKVAIGRFVMRDKQYLATIRPIGELLGLSTMHFADEVRGAGEVDRVPVEGEPDDLQLEIAQQLIQYMSTDWDHSRYGDTYQERVDALIERKARGDKVVALREPEPSAKVTSLLDALRRSIEERTRAGHDRPPSPAHPAGGRPPRET
jgi:DNA end-binding protein Ku